MIPQMEFILKARMALVALGGNITSPAGPPELTFAAAMAALAGETVRISAVSRYFRTPALPAGSGPDYVNAALKLATTLPAAALLDRLHQIEAELARQRNGRWSARTLDLDLIAYEAEVIPDAAMVRRWMALSPERQPLETPDRLLVPHPRMQDRAFVLIPLAEIAATWRHPLTGKSVTEMVAALPATEKAGITPI